MPGQKKGKKFMVSKNKNEEKEKIQQRREEKRKKNIMTSIICKGSLNAVEFEQWLNQHLLPSLKNPSVLLHRQFTNSQKKRYQIISISRG